MTIQLDDGGTSTAPPSLHLENEGDAVTFAVIDSNAKVPMTEYGTGEPLLNHRGEQKMQTVLTVLAVAADGATAGKKDERTPAQPGEVFSIYVSGYGKWDKDEDAKGGTHISWSGAIDRLGRALAVGDVGQWKHLGELPSRGTFPRKNRKFALRAPKPDEADQTQRCEQLHVDMKAAAEAPQTVPSTPLEDEEPF